MLHVWRSKNLETKELKVVALVQELARIRVKGMGGEEPTIGFGERTE